MNTGQVKTEAADPGRVFCGATVWHGARTEPARRWLWIAGGRIREVGDGAPPPGVPRTELDGCHILPGLVDAHRHFTTCSVLPLCGDAAGWRSKTEALEAVAAAHAAHADADAWLVFFAMDHTRWHSGWAPTAAELASVAPGRAVLLCDITLHRGVVSARAFEEAGLAACLPADGFADIERDAGGRPRGMVWERAFGRALAAALRARTRGMDGVARRRLFDAEARRLLAEGHVHVHDIGLAMDDQRALAEWHANTPLRLSWSVASRYGLLEPPAFDEDRDVPSRHAPRSVKFFLDGAHRCAACLPVGALLIATRMLGASVLRQRSLNPLRASREMGFVVRGGHVHLPHLRFADADALAARARPYVEAGYRLRLHALGNSAVVTAAEVIRALGAGPQATIEHALAMAPDDFAPVVAAGALVSLQTGFIPHYADAIRQQGLIPYLAPFPLRSLIDRGVACAISSDAPCGPSNPLFNMRRAVDREDEAGQRLAPEQAVSPAEAVRAASIGGLAALGIVSHGLSAGEAADFVIGRGDPFDEATTVAATWIDGTPAWTRDATPP